MITLLAGDQNYETMTLIGNIIHCETACKKKKRAKIQRKTKVKNWYTNQIIEEEALCRNKLIKCNFCVMADCS